MTSALLLYHYATSYFYYYYYHRCYFTEPPTSHTIRVISHYYVACHFGDTRNRRDDSPCHVTRPASRPLRLPRGRVSPRGSHAPHAVWSHVIYHFRYGKKNLFFFFWQSRCPSPTTWTKPRPSGKKYYFFQNLNFLSRYENFIPIWLCVTYITTIFLFATTCVIYDVSYYCVTYILLHKKAAIKLFYYTVYIGYIILKYVLLWYITYINYTTYYLLFIIYP